MAVNPGRTVVEGLLFLADLLRLFPGVVGCLCANEYDILPNEEPFLRPFLALKVNNDMRGIPTHHFLRRFFLLRSLRNFWARWISILCAVFLVRLAAASISSRISPISLPVRTASSLAKTTIGFSPFSH